MTENKELKKLENDIESIQDENLKKQLKIQFANTLHANGQLPCAGTWDSSTGKCIESAGSTVPPTVEAGEDKDAELGKQVTIYGTVTEFGNRIEYKGFSQIGGPHVDISGSADGTTVTFTPVIEGQYLFEFSTRDEKGLVGSDIVTVNAKKAEPKELKAKKEEKKLEKEEIKKEEPKKDIEIKEKEIKEIENKFKVNEEKPKTITEDKPKSINENNKSKGNELDKKENDPKGRTEFNPKDLKFKLE